MSWNNIKTIEDQKENVIKYIFEKPTAVAEAVLYRYPTYAERTVICCSTQSGCPVGCRFCGAGDYFVRSLSDEEIISQPIKLLDDTKISHENIQRLQIMFMSMGEPLLNFENLSSAIRSLYLKYPRAALLISTSGPKIDYDKVIVLSKEIPTVGLQFSIHESADEKRDRLIPFKGKLTLSEISKVGEKWFQEVGRQPFFNYCAHDKNSSEEDANRLLSLFPPNIWQATISVICERDECVSAANNRQRNLALDFEEKLKSKGFKTRTFDPAGQDTIGGGCGQLWFVQDWMRKHQKLTKHSSGFGLPSVHTPRESPE